MGRGRGVLRVAHRVQHFHGLIASGKPVFGAVGLWGNVIFMGNFLRALNFSIIFLSIALALDAAGVGIFSEALFSPFGVLFFFLAFLNEINMIYL